MALNSERSRIRFKDIEQVSSYDAVPRSGMPASFPEPPANEERGMSPQPQTVGEELRRTRMQAGFDLSDVAAQLRIRSNFLSALEEGRPDALPGITYAIGYVRTYAGFLGLDPEAAVRRFKEEAAGLNSKTQLVFPSPAPEGRVPGLMLMLVAAVLAGGAFGGWYWLSERDGDLRALVPAVPERLAQLIEGDAPPVTGAPVAQTAAPPAGSSYSEANPAGVTVPAPRAAAPAVPAPAVTAPTTTLPTTTLPTATAPAAGTPVTGAPAAQSAAPGPQIAAVTPPPAAGTPTSASPARGLERSLPDGSPIRAPAPAAPVIAPLAAGPSPAAGGAPADPPADGIPDETAPPESTAAGQAVPAAPPIAPAARPAEAAQDVPAAPRIAGLIGASEAAVPPGRTAAGPVERVTIRATGDSWVQVRDAQGTALFTRVLREGDVYRVPEQPGLRLATGNAGALEILVDGAPVPSLGGFGEVVRNVHLDPARLSSGTAAGATR